MARLEADLARLKARVGTSASSRREDAHRKIVLGGAILGFARKNPDAARTVADLLRSASFSERDERARKVLMAELEKLVSGAA
jgi:hypothetical protein